MVNRSSRTQKLAARASPTPPRSPAARAALAGSKRVIGELLAREGGLEPAVEANPSRCPGVLPRRGFYDGRPRVRQAVPRREQGR